MRSIRQYAPVCIPTLNRFNHFKQCLESLEKCIGADETDVYVALDYPPSKKYIEGWEKIEFFLQEKEKRNGFRHLYVIRRDHNCGVGNPGSNARLLRLEMMQNHEVFISSEDDNVFAPCFLEFINLCLEEYKNDRRIRSVTGYTHPFFYDRSKKLLFSYDNNAWGTGYWTKKEKEKDAIKGGYYKDILFSFRKSLKIFLNYPLLLSNLISMVKAKTYYGDTTRTCLNIINNTYQVRPFISLVRNIGVDGTGVHCSDVDKDFFSNQEILETVKYPFVKEDPCLSISKMKMWKFSLTPNTVKKTWIVFASFYFYVKFRLQNRKES